MKNKKYETEAEYIKSEGKRFYANCCSCLVVIIILIVIAYVL